MIKRQWIVFIFLIGMSLQVRAAQCPIPPSSVMPKVSVKIKQLPDGRYRYEYDLKNLKSAKSSLAFFYLVTSRDVQEFHAPTSWTSEFEVGSATRPAFLKIVSSFEDLYPGGAVKMSFISQLRPGLVPYYAEGAPVEFVADPVGGDDEASPDCPGFHDGVSLVRMLTDSTIGPVDLSQVDLRSKISRGLADKNLDELSPLDTGTIQLTVFLGGKVDFESIDLKSVQFGPGKARPILSVSEPQKSKTGRAERLVLTFNISDLRIRCDLDKALFFYAKAGERRIVSSVAVKPAVCSKDLWSKIRKSLPDYNKAKSN